MYTQESRRELHTADIEKMERIFVAMKTYKKVFFFSFTDSNLVAVNKHNDV